MSMRVLVSGATGFVGRALCSHLLLQGYRVRAAVRQRRQHEIDDVEQVLIGDIGPTTQWGKVIADVDVIVHLGARVHVMHESAADPLAEFRAINVVGTERLAVQAAIAGVKRLIYVSTIKVNGDETLGKPFTVIDSPQPRDAYATSKWEAEQALQRVAAQTGLEVVIVRPPLIYGPGVKGNFLSLLHFVEKGWLLPTGGCDNRRSLIGLGNFVDFLTLCIRHPAAAGQIFLVSDGEDLSMPELIHRLASAMGRSARLLSVPPSWLWLATKLLGRSGIYQRLCGSLVVDSGYARQVLGWKPPQTVSDGLASTVEEFLQRSVRGVNTKRGRT